MNNGQITSMNILVIYNFDYDLGDSISGSDGDEPPSCDDALIGNAARAGVFNVSQMISQALYNCGFRNIDCRPVSKLSDVEELLSNNEYDLVFNLCESLDGIAQMEIEVAQLIEKFNVPMTGNSSRALMNCLLKDRCAKILDKNNCVVPRSYLVGKLSDLKKIPFPNTYIVKPNDQDGSTGIEFDCVVSSLENLTKQTKKLLDAFGSKVVVQDYISGREINLAIIGEEPNRFWNCTEIDFTALKDGVPKILNYSAKWDTEACEYKQTVSINAQVSEQLKERLFNSAIKAAKALGIKGYARFDFRVDDATEIPYLIDVNPNCDLDQGSGLARSAMFNGISYDLVVLKIVENAFANFRPKENNRFIENIFNYATAEKLFVANQAIYEN